MTDIAVNRELFIAAVTDLSLLHAGQVLQNKGSCCDPVDCEVQERIRRLKGLLLRHP